MKYALPTLWLIGGALVLALGFLGGVFIGQSQRDTSLHDTYYVMAHEEFLWRVAAPFGVFAVVYFLVRMSGRVPSPWLAGAHFALSIAAAVLLLSPAIGWASWGMPERYVDYEPTFAFWSAVTTGGYVMSAISLVVFLGVLAEMFLTRRTRTA